MSDNIHSGVSERWLSRALTPLQLLMRSKHKTAGEPKGKSISEADAFEILCASCLKAERFPGEILTLGAASGWYHRIREIASSYGWEITITIKDKE